MHNNINEWLVCMCNNNHEDNIASAFLESTCMDHRHNNVIRYRSMTLAFPSIFGWWDSKPGSSTLDRSVYWFRLIIWPALINVTRQWWPMPYPYIFIVGLLLLPPLFFYFFSFVLFFFFSLSLFLLYLFYLFIFWFYWEAA